VDVPVSARFFARSRRMPQFRKNVFQITRYGLNPFSLRSHPEQLLFEVKVEWQ
jgi:hypothetical protein